ncbi:MAG: sugar phosphate isomerase/epimerase [Desulfobacterota bacterium]|nr:sugar phosphate isomerase/epimerase [Thermodesulfobacteriota bacterium]MDW8001188.1 sugar phosphate isomerase/epimerase family protein [Deltaproteobacteria bacterium]
MSRKNVLINVPYDLIEANIKRIVDLNLGIEVYFENNLIDELKENQIKELSKKLKENGIICTCHAPYFDLSPGGIDRRVRSITIEKLKKTFFFAQLLEARVVICHPGYSKWYFDGNEEIWFENSILTWNEVLKEKDKNVTAALENVFEETPETLIELIKYFKGQIFFCFDTGHFNLFSKTNMEAWLLPLKDWLVEFHLHDNYGTNDDHMPIGYGNFPFRELKAFIKALYRSELFFVAEPHDEASALESIKSIRDFLSSL